MGIPTVPGEDAAVAIAASLAPRRGLLVLDTCEHVVAGAASLVGRVLREARDLVVLATSQRPLGVNGEIAWPVPPLALAPPGITSVTDALSYPAIALFVDRAAAVRSEFELTEANLSDVVAICLALDGLPLAIELAAARSDMLSPGAIRQRLEHRFDLLVDGARDLAPRQQTLRAAVDWSADLLDDQHRRFFARLAVFPATFDLDAAAAVAAEPGVDDPLRMLTDLVRQSMVAVPGPDRFRLLDTLRAYAAELLADADADATSHRHAQHYLELAERGEVGIRGPDQLHWLELLRAAVPQHRAALEWMLSTGDAEGAARLAGALGWFWVVDGLLADAHHHLGQIVDLPGLSDRVRARVSWTLALAAGSLGDLQRCRTLGAMAADLGRAIGDDAIIGYGLNAEAVALWGSGQLDESAALHERAVRHSEAAGDVWGVGVCTVLRARTAVDADDPAAAEMTRHAVEAARRTGDAHIIGIALEQCARVALNDGDPAGALALVEESLAGHEAISYSEGILASLHLLGRASSPMAIRSRRANVTSERWGSLSESDTLPARSRHSMDSLRSRSPSATHNVRLGSHWSSSPNGLHDICLAVRTNVRCSTALSPKQRRQHPATAHRHSQPSPTRSSAVRHSNRVDQWALCESGRRSSRRNSWAFSATTIVDTLIKIAPTAGESVTPTPASTPAARGMATML